jgi:hypothetical protein
MIGHMAFSTSAPSDALLPGAARDRPGRRTTIHLRANRPTIAVTRCTYRGDFSKCQCLHNAVAGADRCALPGHERGSHVELLPPVPVCGSCLTAPATNVVGVDVEIGPRDYERWDLLRCDAHVEDIPDGVVVAVDAMTLAAAEHITGDLLAEAEVTA